MGNLLVALLPLITDAVAGESVAAALSGLTIAQWVTIAAQTITAEPQIVAALKKLHPAIEKFVTDVRNGVEIHAAAAEVHGLFSKAPQVPGYMADGSLGAV
jgi:hypothetical protein